MSDVQTPDEGNNQDADNKPDEEETQADSQPEQNDGDNNDDEG